MINLIKNESLKIGYWQKGKTVEYFIYPENKEYINRDFLFRISSATIDSSNAVFTKFDGYTRYLVMLNNSLSIKVNNNNLDLTKNDVLKFKSSDDVISYSIGKDFNLMVSEAIKYSDVFTTDNISNINYDFIIVFALSDCCININEEYIVLAKYDCILIHNKIKQSYSINSNKDCIFAYINN